MNKDYTKLPRLITLAQLEEYYGLKTSTVRKWLMTKGKFTPAKKIGSKWFIDTNKMNEWLDQDQSEMSTY